MTNENPFSAFQKDKVTARIALIQARLETLAKRRTQFKFITDLAEDIAEYIGKEEGASCNRATLLRNVAYKALLQDYMVDYCGAENKQGSGKNSLVNELEISNLRREVERLRAYATSLEKRLDARPAPATPGQAIAIAQDGVGISDLMVDHALTCKAMLLLMKNFEGLVAVDDTGQRIIDLSKRRNNEIVDAVTAKPFLDWLKKNSSLGS